MMNTFRKLYKDFFGLKEAVTSTSKIPKILPADEIEKSTVAMQKYGQEMKKAGLIETDDLDEAQLINHITDYNGGVEYVLRNPAEAKQVSAEIRDWAEKKGFVVLKQKVSANGKVGYFYFKLGQDPALESQRIQGYIAQKPEVKHFRFNVRGQKKPEVRPENPSM